MNLISIPAFQDNYIWVVIENHGRCIIVDPGEAAPVLAAIEENQWQPEAILLTHHHQDHVGGVKQLREKFPLWWFTGRQKPVIRGYSGSRRWRSVVNSGSRFFHFLHASHTLDISVTTANLICFAATQCSPAAAEGCSKAPQSKCINHL